MEISHRRRRARGNVVFTVTVTAAMLLGALIMAAVLLAEGAPVAVVIGAVMAALPVGPVIAAYLWLDRYEPEPRILLLLAVGWGAVVATSAALIIQIVDAIANDSTEFHQGVVVAPLTEEFAKGFFLVLLFWLRRAEFDGILDGIVYAGMVGIGFAFTENILYLGQAYVGDETTPGGMSDLVTLFILRGVFSPFAHPFFTAFFGIGLGIAVNTRKRGTRILAPIIGYALAVGAHALWNASMMIGDGDAAVAGYFLVMMPAFLLMIGFALWVRRQEGRILAVALGDCANRGFLDAAEVPWLTHLPARYSARRYAARAGGPPAAEVMKDYQAAAVELGFLHYRYLRGTPPAHYDVLGQDYVQQMYQLRPGVIWPPSDPQATGAQR